MGYILPVGQHQYSQYHQRVAGEKKSPFVIERPFRVELETRRKHPFEYAEERRRMSLRYNNQNSPKNSEQAETAQLYTPGSITSHSAERNFSKITGKGQYFSESI
ncbi:hypothetical protein J2R98_001615 [Alkalibacillus filiformis]|uniref:Uncharacterized protein n=1 Tax=Alkalibacillus filiformis TaxID=200990 RepID=A0ABU0DTL9_9BACI|nr:hypothetical protein [Alkalibacillus filiformis]MDQ0351798.1 hypothetical protein [Alkalibacillus filiformis]